MMTNFDEICPNPMDMNVRIKLIYIANSHHFIYKKLELFYVYKQKFIKILFKGFTASL